jgi:hypothetical protein
MKRSSESGNILLYILIAVALLASLSYAVTRSNTGSAGQLDSERARLAATEILEYGSILGNAASQLRLRGCKLTEISFEGATGTYTNPSAPTDHSCDVFNTAGGGVSLQAPPVASVVSTATPWTFSADMEVNEVGTTCAADACADLVAYIPGVKDVVCDALNTLAGIDTPTTRPVQADASYSTFQGAYTYVDTLGDEAGTDKLSGKSAGCFQSTADGVFIAYKILLSR